MTMTKEEVWRHVEALGEEDRAWLARMLAGRPRTTHSDREVAWWQGVLDAGAPSFWHSQMPLTADLLASYVEATGHAASPRGSGTAMGQFLHWACPGYERVQRTHIDGRRRYYSKLPPLAEARAAFERLGAGRPRPAQQAAPARVATGSTAPLLALLRASPAGLDVEAITDALGLSAGHDYRMARNAIEYLRREGHTIVSTGRRGPGGKGVFRLVEPT